MKISFLIFFCFLKCSLLTNSLESSSTDSSKMVPNMNLKFRLILTKYELKFVQKKEYPLGPMGVLATGSAHPRPSSQPPIETSGNFPAEVSAESPSNISPNANRTPQKSHPKFWNPRTTFGNIPHRPPNHSIVRGVGWVPNFLGCRILEASCQISEP
jgi:hypothetical protein